MLKFTPALFRTSKNNKFTLRINAYFSVSATAEPKNVNLEANKPYEHQIKKEQVSNSRFNANSGNGIVAAAFASLRKENVNLENEIATPFTDNRVAEAKTVDELLSISGGNGVSRKHAFKVCLLV